MSERSLKIWEITGIVEDALVSNPDLQNVTVQGEVISLTKNPGSGHIYFTLSDKEGDTPPAKKAILKCVFFRFNQGSLDFPMQQGQELLVTGSITVYQAGGAYNFRVQKVQKLGLGNLLLKIQQLRQRLATEGLIDPSRRRKLPLLPRRIGVVTGLGTAALRDILKQVNDRYPNVEVLIAPAQVQGENAPNSIRSALAEISKPEWKVDVIIFGRGGGSVEELMPFNDEELARTVAALPVPSVSAVGHQIDHPISDDVADVAAATPTDAAKIVLPQIDEFESRLQMVSARLSQLVRARLENAREKMLRFGEKPYFRDPRVLLENYMQRLDQYGTSLSMNFREIIEKNRRTYRELGDLSAPLQTLIEEKRLKLAGLQPDTAFRLYLNRPINRFQLAGERLSAYSPLSTLKRGYSIVYQKEKVVTSVKDLDSKGELNIRFHDGKVTARISSD